MYLENQRIVIFQCCSFLLHNNMNQLYAHVYPLPPEAPSLGLYFHSLLFLEWDLGAAGMGGDRAAWVCLLGGTKY